jgi:hypothetical protein
MKKVYISPEVIITELRCEDIISTSLPLPIVPIGNKDNSSSQYYWYYTGYEW